MTQSTNVSEHVASTLSHVEEQAERKTSVKANSMIVTCFRAGFLCGLFFDPEDGGDMFLRNVG
jgi:hypothetical protein